MSSGEMSIRFEHGVCPMRLTLAYRRFRCCRPVPIRPLRFQWTSPKLRRPQGLDRPPTLLCIDSLVIPVTVRITTVLEAKDGDSTTYRWYATSADNEPVSTFGVDTVLGNGTLTFNGNGRIIGDPVATIAVQREDTASDLLEFDLDFTQVSGLAVSNNLGQQYGLSMTRQDGFPPGTLSSFI